MKNAVDIQYYKSSIVAKNNHDQLSSAATKKNGYMTPVRENVYEIFGAHKCVHCKTADSALRRKDIYANTHSNEKKPA